MLDSRLLGALAFLFAGFSFSGESDEPSGSMATSNPFDVRLAD